MTRDFTEETKRQLIKQIEAVTETTNWGKVADFFGDIWLTLQEWTGSLNISNYLNDVDAYHKKILDKRNTSVDQIKRIFQSVESVDRSARGTFQSATAEIVEQAESLRRITDILGVPVSNFTATNINGYFNGEKKLGSLYTEKHTNGRLPNERYKEITPPVTNAEGYRSAEAYEEVISSLDVENTVRYQRTADATWCNIYVWDVTTAMGCEIPHYYNPKTGEPMTRAEALKAGKGGYLEMSANRMTTWLENHGESYGWIECDEKTAIAMASQGYPTVTAATTTGHVAMVAPQRTGESGVMISQAGGYNFDHGTLKSGFGQYSSNVKYFYHA